MSKLRIKLLAASVGAFLVADAASAQVVTFGGGRGVTVGNPAVGYGTPYPGGWNSVNLGRGVSVGLGSPYYGSPYAPYSSNYSGWNTPYRGTWNSPYTYGSTQPFVTRSGRVVYSTNPTYSTAPNVVYSSGQPATYSPMQSSGIVQSSGFVTDASGGIVQTGGFTVPQQMGGVIQSGAITMPQADMASGQIAAAQVLAPDGAKVTLNGTPADRLQGARPFISPPLDPSKTYTYRAKATWTDENGREQTREKSKDVKAGEQIVIDLTRTDSTNTPAVNDRTE